MTWSRQMWESAYEKALMAFSIIIGSGITINICVCLIVIGIILSRREKSKVHCYMFN